MNHIETLKTHEDTTYRTRVESSSVKIKIFKDFFCYYSNAGSSVKTWTACITVCTHTTPLHALPFTEQKRLTQQNMPFIDIQPF